MDALLFLSSIKDKSLHQVDTSAIFLLDNARLYIQLSFIQLQQIQMSVQGEEKKMLIESMKKLKYRHVSNNQQRQNEIFDALSLQDLNKIILNLKDENEYLRRISSLLLCELFYNNFHTKTGITKLLNIQPKWGRICLNGIPESIQKYPSTLKKCIELMQSSPTMDQENKVCWVINLQKKSLKIQTLQYKNYTSYNFIDPLKNIFGFFIKNPKDQTQIQKQVKKDTAQSQPVQHITVSNSPVAENRPSYEFYNNYLQYRNKSKEAKRYSVGGNSISLSINHQNDKRQTPTRPPTAQQITNSYFSKKQDINTTLDLNRPNTIQAYSQYDRSNYSVNRNKLNTSYQQISESPNNKISQSYNLKSYTNNSVNKQKQTQFNRRSDLIESKYTNPVIRQKLSENDNFYKRVKDILKK